MTAQQILGDIDAVLSLWDGVDTGSVSELGDAGDLLSEMLVKLRPLIAQQVREQATAGLTTRQREALRELESVKRVWPRGHGRFAITDAKFSKPTLQALVDAGLARWATPVSGVMPHIIPQAI